MGMVHVWTIPRKIGGSNIPCRNHHARYADHSRRVGRCDTCAVLPGVHDKRFQVANSAANGRPLPGHRRHPTNRSARQADSWSNVVSMVASTRFAFCRTSSRFAQSRELSSNRLKKSMWLFAQPQARSRPSSLSLRFVPTRRVLRCRALLPDLRRAHRLTRQSRLGPLAKSLGSKAGEKVAREFRPRSELFRQ